MITLRIFLYTVHTSSMFAGSSGKLYGSQSPKSNRRRNSFSENRQPLFLPEAQRTGIELSLTITRQHRGACNCAFFSSYAVTMVAAIGGSFFEGSTGRNTRGLLRVIILATIAGAAISSRLFSVIRFESIIHECKKINEFQPNSSLTN